MRLDHTILPTCVKVGLAPALTHSFRQPFWGEQLQQPEDMLKAGAADIGIPKAHMAHGAAIEDKMVEAALKQLSTPPTEVHSARQVFTLLKQLRGPPHMPLPWTCPRTAPTAINVYTDGSWQLPLVYYFALGGAGVWWPGRQLHKHKISRGEAELAYASEEADGVRLATNIGGYSGSSTRTELAAGILALLNHGPVHLGSDSAAFVNRAQQLVLDVKAGRPMSQCWQTTADGDLWLHLELAIRAKGPDSIQFTWIKGHATDAHIAAGITTLANKVGNDHADQIADERCDKNFKKY